LKSPSIVMSDSPELLATATAEFNGLPALRVPRQESYISKSGGQIRRVT
jgi:hypothetical protein